MQRPQHLWLRPDAAHDRGRRRSYVVAIDDATDSVYVVTLKGKVVVIDGRTCDATVTFGCAQTPQGVTIDGFASFVAINQQTNTIYTANGGANGHGHTVSVIDGRTCNATRHSGCGQAPPTVAVGLDPLGLPLTRRQTPST